MKSRVHNCNNEATGTVVLCSDQNGEYRNEEMWETLLGPRKGHKGGGDWAHREVKKSGTVDVWKGKDVADLTRNWH
jgi:hypothetical protein